MQDYSFTKHRIIQWVGILLALGVIAVSYWYFSARAGVKINTTLTDPLSEGLAGYWKLDDGSGTSATDSSTNGNNGTLTNGPTWTTGQIGGAVAFDGTDDYIDTNNGSALDSLSEYAYVAWIYPTSADGFIVAKASNGGGSSGFRLTSSTLQGWRANFTNWSAARSTSSTTVSLNTWSHVVMTYSHTGDKKHHIYLNGTEVAYSEQDTNPVGLDPDPNYDFLIGRKEGGNEMIDVPFTGNIDEVRIYNRSLSSDEVSDLYRLTSPSGTDTSLKGYWSFNGKDVSGTTAYDRSGAGNNGTLTNGPTVTQGKVGQALNFTTDNSNVSIADNNVLDLQSTLAGTFSAWIYNNGDIAAYQNIAEKGVNTPMPWQIYLLDNSLNLGFYSDVSGVVDSGYAIPTGKWVHVTVTVASTTALFYVDGNLVATKTGQIGGNSSQGVVIGSFNTSNDFNGFIDEVRVYNTALTAAQIQSLYKQGQADEVNTGASQAQGTGRLDSGLAGYWKMDDGSGTSATDSSTNANTGTLTNGPTWTTGQIGGAVNFDGSDDYVNTASDIPFTDTFTFSAWFYTTDNSQTGIIFGEDSGTTGNTPKIGIVSNNFFVRLVSGGSNDAAVAVPTSSSWNHLVVTRDSSNKVNLYVNGGSARRLFSDVAQSATYTLDTIGANGDTISQYFNGKIDEVRVYNRPLSSDEVTELYRLTSPTGTDTSLKGYWSFNGKDISGTTAYDRSGAGNNGTLTNGPTVTPGKVGQALSFDGTDDKMSFSAFTTGTTFTLSLWVRPNAQIESYGALLIQGTGLQLGLSYRGSAAGSNAGKVSYWDSGGEKLSSTAIANGVWSHIAVVVSAGNLQFYTNSVPNGTASSITSLNLSVMGDNSLSETFKGSLDEVRIYNTALTVAQIQALYNQGQSDEVNTSVSQPQGRGRLDSGLAGYWPLDNGSGTTATDGSVNGNNGTLTNGPTWTTGQIGSAVDFDGTDDYIAVADPSSGVLDFSVPSAGNYGDVFAVAGWFNRDTFTTDDTIIAKKNDQGNVTAGYAVWIDDADDKLYVVVCGASCAGATSPVTAISTTTYTTTDWHYFVITVDQSRSTGGGDSRCPSIWVDGVAVTSNSCGEYLHYTGNLGNSLALTLGAESDGGNPFDGKLDDIRIYNRPVTPSDIKNLYINTATTVASDSTLKGYWDFNSSAITGTIAHDISGYGNDGTLTNGPTVTPGKVGQALSFDGTDDYVNVPDSAALSPTSAMTVSFWANVTNISLQCRTFLAKNTSGGRSWFITTTTSGAVAFYVASNTNDSSTNGTTGGGLVSQNSWVHIVSVFDGSGSDNAGRAKVYVNGVQQLMTFSGTVAATLTDTSQAIRFGESAGGCTALPGSLDEVRIYNTALTASQIQALYNAGK